MQPESPSCDVCGKRPSRYEVPVFKSYGQREHVRDEHWCGPCRDKIVEAQPGDYMWKHVTDGWLRPPKPSMKARLKDALR